MFQSLIGILVDLEQQNAERQPEHDVSIPDRDFSWFRVGIDENALALKKFQSLIGILVDLELPLPTGRPALARFQSLIGILVDLERISPISVWGQNGFNPW